MFAHIARTIPSFAEIIIDNQGPENIWMKTYGDINGDEKIDIVIGGNKSCGLVAYLAPDWKKFIINDSLFIKTDGEVFDVNNNGIQDIVVISSNTLMWLTGPDWEYNLIDSVTLHDLEVADFDKDGLIDIVGRNQAEWGRGDTLFFYHQKPAGVWTQYRRTVVNGEGLIAADVNNNGKPDIIINGYWLENAGNIKNWKEHKFTDTWDWRNTYIDFADINDNGKSDIILSPAELQGHYYRVSWFEQPEDPTLIWEEHIIADSVETVEHFVGAADFNLNGKMDIMTADMKQGAFPQEVAVYYQKGKDKWKKEVISTEGSHSMILYDFDRDGDIDAAGANHQENILKMWINQTIK